MRQKDERVAISSAKSPHKKGRHPKMAFSLPPWPKCVHQRRRKRRPHTNFIRNSLHEILVSFTACPSLSHIKQNIFHIFLPQPILDCPHLFLVFLPFKVIYCIQQSGLFTLQKQKPKLARLFLTWDKQKIWKRPFSDKWQPPPPQKKMSVNLMKNKRNKTILIFSELMSLSTTVAMSTNNITPLCSSGYLLMGRQ